MQRFKDKVALVTGAASGIGLATARRLAQEGAQVFACDISAERLEQEVAAIQASGGRAVSHVLDVSSAEACGAAVARAVEVFGRLDILANIAGILLSKHCTDISDAEWKRVMDINLNGPFALCRAAVPHLLATQGAIVNVVSTAGLVGQAYNTAYCASKGGLLLLTKALAVEYAKQGLRVNAVCPGGVKTALVQNATFPEDADFDMVGKLMPLVPDICEPEEIAGAIAYLASEEARFCIGSTLVIDGGQTAI